LLQVNQAKILPEQEAQRHTSRHDHHLVSSYDLSRLRIRTCSLNGLCLVFWSIVS
jgi:hypothetical protein